MFELREEVMTVDARIDVDCKLWCFGQGAQLQAEIQPKNTRPGYTPRAMIYDYRVTVIEIAKILRDSPKTNRPNILEVFELAVRSPARVVIEKVGDKNYDLSLYQSDIANPDKILTQIYGEFSPSRGKAFGLVSDPLWQFKSCSLTREYRDEYTPRSVVSADFVFLFLTGPDNPVYLENREIVDGKERAIDQWRITDELEELRYFPSNT